MSRLAAVARTTSFAAIIAAVFPVLAVIAPKSTVIVLVAAGLYGMSIAVRRRIPRDLFPLVPAPLWLPSWDGFSTRAWRPSEGGVSFELWLRLTALALRGFGALWLFGALSSEEKRGGSMTRSLRGPSLACRCCGVFSSPTAPAGSFWSVPTVPIR